MRRKRGFESTKKTTKYINVANALTNRWSIAKADAIGQTDHSNADLQLEEAEDDTTAKTICLGMSYILDTCKQNVILEWKQVKLKKLSFLSKFICASNIDFVSFYTSIPA